MILDEWLNPEATYILCLENEWIGRFSLFIRFSTTWACFKAAINLVMITSHLLCFMTNVWFHRQIENCCIVWFLSLEKANFVCHFSTGELMFVFCLLRRLLCLWILSAINCKILFRYWGFGFMLFDNYMFLSFFSHFLSFYVAYSANKRILLSWTYYLVDINFFAFYFFIS